MKAVILAGGRGTRLSEETIVKPKPMVEIGEEPIIWHILKIYSHYGVNDFIICLGYKGYMIKEYFANYFLHQSNITVDLKENKIIYEEAKLESWRITLVDTGLYSQTGARIKKIQKYVGNETFLLTYGDGVADINIKKLIEYHYSKGKYATVTAVQPAGKFGSLELNENGNVINFVEKPKGDKAWISGGFFVLEPKIFDYLPDGNDNLIWEGEPLEKLAADGQLAAYKHEGFWKPMDTLRDKIELEELWNSEKAPWKVWD